ncbi:MAG: hypothetical protein ACTHW1_01625 [Ancrocorticia sp.]|uniref:hypothetical protein n=1 Tax=Ancrocorticia sp. TaxID=2593684 RepID=UPI003F9365E7
MSKASLPAPIHQFKTVVESVVEAASRWVDSAAEAVVRDVVGWTPRVLSDDDGLSTSTPSTVNRPERASRFADTEEISWLESGRHELPYRRDKRWAVAQMWWEMGLGGVGATTYLASSIARNPVGMAAGWALAAGGKGILLLADLGRPERFPLVFSKPKTSWIARGSWAFAAFAGAGAVSLVPFVPKPARIGAAAVANAGACVLAVYDGYFLNDSKAVASWRPAVIPWMFAAGAMQAGTALTGALSSRPSRPLAVASTAFGVVSAVLTDVYIKQLAQGGTSARLSARDLIEGVQKDRFLVTGGAVGTAIPAVLTVVGSASPIIQAVAAAASATGVEHVRRAVLQAGMHAPIIDPPRRRPAGEGRQS